MLQVQRLSIRMTITFPDTSRARPILMRFHFVGFGAALLPQKAAIGSGRTLLSNH
jgi:hypothetical protein